MHSWRICRRLHAADPLSGRGGLLVAGRWHFKGARLVYSSATLSLAALELLVHSDRDLLPSDLIRIEIEIPDDLKIERIDVKALPADWRAYPAPRTLQQVGDWLSGGASAVLQVPSAVIPEEYNYLLSPGHRDAARIQAVTVADFVLDPRLSSN